MRGELDPLQFAAGEGRHRLVEVEVAEADAPERKEFFTERFAGEEFRRFVHGHVHHFGDVLPVIRVGERLFGVALPAA
ncbi:hypothetical protein SDC9_183414 [bioreactor metagenome]|uniref:Uncharacterized protein n=1 Tax=bioreactor metagenome TaxID=1076179 RepID=A0A645HA49_9ZZZZ